MKTSFKCPHCDEVIYTVKTEPSVRVQRYERMKVSPMQAEISLRFFRGESQKALAKAYGTSGTRVRSIIMRAMRFADGPFTWENRGALLHHRKMHADHWIHKITINSSP